MSLLTKAISYAAEKHDGQTRKGTDIPYIVHPMEAATIAATITNNENVIAAAVLHDVVEDCGVSLQEIEILFGEQIAKLVAADSEDKREYLSAESTWKTRKQETLDAIAIMDKDSRIVVLSDKLSNIRAMYRDYAIFGDDLWKRFNCKDTCEQGWYYKSIAKLLKDDLIDTDAWIEYSELVNFLFED